MKNIKDYLHLYLGCECTIQRSFKGVFNYWVVGDKAILDTNLLMDLGNDSICTYTPSYCKPILRPLSDMTEEEKKEVQFSITPSGYKYSPKTFVWLLSKYFDLFGLIEAGLAIDKTTLKEKV